MWKDLEDVQFDQQEHADVVEPVSMDNTAVAAQTSVVSKTPGTLSGDPTHPRLSWANVQAHLKYFSF